MRRYSKRGYSLRKTRYPKRRGIPRVLFLLGLPVLLVGMLLGFCSGGSSDKPGAGHTTSSGASAPIVAPKGVILSPVAGKSLAVKEAYPQGALAGTLIYDKLLLEKRSRRLTAFSGGKPVRVYLVAIGRAPHGHKEREGDMRTPEGLYETTYKDPYSAYYKSIGISYPSAEDEDRARSKGMKPGGKIELHGLAASFADIGDEHRLTDWTFGSIAVTNREMEELYQHTPAEGIPIEIRP